ncbi:uncharacterized protein [Watersipora subatra]|uniref:uncharacterized protein n=1 Tax=Watersipora subatra TaxID=2589382 RepID=UPI00355C07F7
MVESKTIKIAIGVAVVGVLALIIGLVASSLKKLDSFEIGLKYDTINKNLQTEVFREGLHTGPPGYEMIVFPSIYTTNTIDDTSCLNMDGVTIKLDVSYQFKARPNDLYKLVTQFKDFDTYQEVLSAAGFAAVQVVCSKFDTNDIQTNRTQFTVQLKVKLQERCELFFCDVNDVQVNDIRRPASYESAIRDKQEAVENVQVAVEERPKEQTKAQTQLKEANYAGRILVQKAESEARILEFQAETEAQAIINRYELEAATYANISRDLNLTPEGLISYVGIRTIEKTPNPVYIGLKAPAKSSYVP